MSEFVIAFRAVPVGAAATDPARVRLSHWFDHSVNNPGRASRHPHDDPLQVRLRRRRQVRHRDVQFRGQLLERRGADASNAELRNPARGLGWPL